MRYNHYPLHVNNKGRTHITTNENHIKQLIEQILFTIPGERVNRPTFGGGVHRLLFAPLNEDLVTTTRSILQSSLTEYLSGLIIVEDLDVSFDESKLIIDIIYTIRANKTMMRERFEKELQ